MKIAGTEVKDAAEPLVISVAKSDTRAGTIRKPEMCAAARALHRHTGCEEARVHLSRTYIKKKGKWSRYATPQALRNEIIAFDRGGEFAPGEYILEPVAPAARLDAPPSRAKHNGRSKQRPRHMVPNLREQMKADWE